MSELAELYKDINVCKNCDLYKTAARAVPGEGPENAKIMFIGEGPGWNEDQQGRPFVGAAGTFLNHLLDSICLKREEIYITNIVKHRPPNNREPLPGEISACKKWLDKQMELIQPRIIVTLGRYSLSSFFPNKSISKVHGTFEKRDCVTYFAMYHPAAALYQQSLRYEMEQDMLKMLPILDALKSESQESIKNHQLSMF